MGYRVYGHDDDGKQTAVNRIRSIRGSEESFKEAPGRLFSRKAGIPCIDFDMAQSKKIYTNVLHGFHSPCPRLEVEQATDSLQG